MGLDRPSSRVVGTNGRRTHPPPANQLSAAPSSGQIPTCIAPGCRKPTISCDIDHTRPWSETGVTDSENLGPLCRPDHCTRHQSGWTYTILPDGDILWSSPIGTTYTVHGADPP
jgi:hypothetical protein